MRPGEIARVGEPQLLERRLALLQAACPVCDEDKVLADCTCHEDLAEVELIEVELRRRGRKGL